MNRSKNSQTFLRYSELGNNQVNPIFVPGKNLKDCSSFGCPVIITPEKTITPAAQPNLRDFDDEGHGPNHEEYDDDDEDDEDD